MPATQLVIEAKREGVYFDLPAGFIKSTAQLTTLREGNAQIETAVDQALQYALTRGVGIAAVCNGHQLIAFIASRVDGRPPAKGRALVFRSLADMEERFRELWDALSKDGVASRNLYSQLGAEGVAPPPAKLAQRLVDYPGSKNRNPVAAELQILGGMFMEDILRHPEVEPEFLRNCYYSHGSLSQYALVSRELLQTRYSALLQQQAGVSVRPARDKAGIPEELLQDIYVASLSKRPIILLGDVGVGKSIFIRHLIHVDAAETLERALVFYVDFGSQPAIASDLRAFVHGELARQLRENHGIDIRDNNMVRGIYHGELERFSRGIYADLRATDPSAYRTKELEYLESLVSDKENHLRNSLQHAQQAQQRQSVIFLDNVDQRPGQFQEEVFLIAQSLAATWPVTCFVALRPETFFRSKAHGSLSGYQPRVFTISPPRVDRVIQKRLAFARRLLAETGRLPSFPEGTTLQSERLDQYIEMLEQAFRDNERLIEFVENMSNGNVRKALDSVVSFVGSGHVDAKKILKILEEGGRYHLPVHEFVRAVIHGDHEHYFPGDSAVGNVLDVSTPDGREHFLLPLIIEFLAASAAAEAKQGFVSIQDTHQFAQSLGFQPYQTSSALERALHWSLVEPHPKPINGDYDGKASPTHLRVTSAGLYSVRRLLAMFTYLDAMVVDTPIVDSEVRASIDDARTIADRLARVDELLGYLDTQWAPLRSRELPLEWPSVSKAVRVEVEEIQRRTATT